MRRIDRDTVQKILDTADIVEVVSDFVSLKKRGANYIGLCPFHNERTPSFSVSRTKGICKCFSCGKGGSAVGFLMELEQMSYSDALRYLAKKYNIEIQDHEMTAEEREKESERESMLAVNEFAMQYFEKTLTESDDGRNIGLAYFRERGINDAMVKRFHLGYSLEKPDDLYQSAVKRGFAQNFLFDTGLCYNSERGGVRDRFRGRVIYPVFTISGKVVAFGGRTLRKSKDVSKYVNSPESIIYRKSHELYGLYQSKQAIVKKDKCILVEGYMDVISMHQSGVENVVASSGTSLTEGQIRLIHRFTENVTVIYDSDAAGIKASLRGIDLLLAEGLNVKVLSLPDGDDPDSFAQTHTSAEVEEYLAANEQDFIAFKTSILLDGVGNDPIAKSKAIQNIVHSIAVIPDNITRSVYITECSRTLGIDEKVLMLQVSKYGAENAEKQAREQQRERNRAAAGLPSDPRDDEHTSIGGDEPAKADAGEERSEVTERERAFLAPYERELVRYAVKYGACYLCDAAVDASGETKPVNVIDYMAQELGVDDIKLSDAVMARLFSCCLSIIQRDWVADSEAERANLERIREQQIAEGIEQIRNSADDLSQIHTRETELHARVNASLAGAMEDFAEQYLQRRLLSSEDDVVRRTTMDMVSSRHSLSKIHTKYSYIASERDRLAELIPLAVYNLKCALIECEIKRVNVEIASVYAVSPNDSERLRGLLQRGLELNSLKKELAKYLGERILSPR